MPNPIYRNYPTETGAQAPINLDWLGFGAVTITVTNTAGAPLAAAAVEMEFTLDDVIPAAQGGQAGAAAAAHWVDLLSEVPLSDADGYYVFRHPVLWIRPNIITNAAGVCVKVVQNSTARF